MSVNDEFNMCSEELNRLREEYQKLSSNPSDSQLENVSKLAANQLISLVTVDDNCSNFLENNALMNLLGEDFQTLTTPSIDTAVNLRQIIYATLKTTTVLHEIKRIGTSVDQKLPEKLKNTAYQLKRSRSHNRERNCWFRNIGQYYASTELPDFEEFGDSTIDTIISENVFTSSPI